MSNTGLMLGTFVLWLIVASAYLIARVGELRIHRSNYDFLTFANAEELIPSLMKRYYGIIYFILPLAALEHYLWPAEISRDRMLFALLLLGAGLGLRFWTMKSLGRLWSMRCMAINGVEPVKTGPFRILSHPEYTSRILDGFGLLLFLGTWLSGFLYLIIIGYLTSKIIAVESRQLSELSGTFAAEHP